MYGVDLATFLSSDHRFSLDGDAVAEIGGLSGANSGGIFTRAGICRDVTNCYSTNGTTDRIVIPTTGNIDASSGSFAFCCWVQLTEAQLPFCRLFGIGNSTNSRSIVTGPGNSLTFEADNGTFEAQRYADRNLQANRPYHLLWLWDSSGLRAFLDGVEQTNGNDFSQSSVTLNAATPIEIGDPAGTVSLGGTALVLVAPVIMDMNELQFFDPSGLTDQQIFDEAFANGAIPGVTITDQAGLDAIASTVRGDQPLNILVDVAGNIDLTADNVTHDALASCHVQYTGTGVCNWTNTNGSNASIGSAPDGTLNFINPAILTVEGLVVGGEFRIYEDDGVDSNDFGTELDGIETLLATSFDFSHNGTINTIVIQMIASGFEEVRQRVVLGSGDTTVTVTPVPEENV